MTESRAGGSGGADAQEVKSRVSVQVGVIVREWSHQRYIPGETDETKPSLP